MIVLVDYNLTGYVVLFQGTLASEGWLDLLSVRFVTLKEAGLAVDSNDRIIWRFAQSNQMLLLTANRNAKGKDSLVSAYTAAWIHKVESKLQDVRKQILSIITTT